MRIENIIVHCTASLWACAREIRHWHTDPKPQGRGWRDIGYHFIILNGRPVPGLYLPVLDGTIECGRYINDDLYIEGLEAGAHALGYNANSIGICMVGKDLFTENQFRALLALLMDLCKQYRIDPNNVIGHYETPLAHGKTCPNFDVAAFREILKYEISKKEAAHGLAW